MIAKLSLLLLFAVVSVMGQSDQTVACDKTITPIDKFTWSSFNTTWFELYKSDKRVVYPCTNIHFMKNKDTNYTIHFMSKVKDGDEIKDKDTMQLVTIAKDDVATFTIGELDYNVVAYAENSYMVIHACEDVKAPAGRAEPPVLSKSYTYILGAKESLNFKDIIGIQTAVNDKVKAEIKSDSMSSTVQWGPICNSGPISQILTALLVACAALTRLI